MMSSLQLPSFLSAHRLALAMSPYRHCTEGLLITLNEWSALAGNALDEVISVANDSSTNGAVSKCSVEYKILV